MEQLFDKYYKVNQTGGSYVVALYYNPITHATKTVLARDYDYSDASRDNDEVYYEPINEIAKEDYRRYLNSQSYGFVSVGDTVQVVKGRKVPIGTIAKVVRVYDWRDCNGRVKATYAEFSDGRRTSVYNCLIIG